MPFGNIRKIVVYDKIAYLLVEDHPVLLVVDFHNCYTVQLPGNPLDCCVFNQSLILTCQSKIEMLIQMNVQTRQITPILIKFTEYSLQSVPKDIIKPSIDYIFKMTRKFE